MAIQDSKIFNPKTRKYVNRDGRIGKQILKKYHVPNWLKSEPGFEDFRLSNRNCEDVVNAKGWIVGDELGKGEQGKTYVACYHNNCKYVFKIFEVKKLTDYNDFISEVEALTELNKKVPDIVPKLYGSWTCGMYCVIAMEMMINDKDRINNLTFDQVRLLLDKLAKVGWLHIDIHKGNIMFRENGDPVLIDFGYAQKLNKSTLNNPINIDRNQPLNYTQLKDIQYCNLLQYFGNPNDPLRKDDFKIRKMFLSSLGFNVD